MIIDIILVILLILAAIKGYQRGLIVAVFSVAAFIIGLAAAIKLSAVVADYIGEAVKVSEQWLPVISFAVVFLLVVLLVRWGAGLLQKTAEATMLGWANRIGGILFYAALYILIYGVFIFYAEQVEVLQKETIQSSVTYPYIQPWGPKVIDGFGKIIPVFKDMFTDLETFFGKVSGEIAPAG
jgi:membrane protein required for colicin V production